MRVFLLFTIILSAHAVNLRSRSLKGGKKGGKRGYHSKSSKGSITKNSFRTIEVESLATKVPSPSPTLPSDDLGLRFSKITFPNNEVPSDAELPMTPRNYPLKVDTFSWLRLSQCPSIIVESECFECDISFAELVDSVGGHPSHPSSNEHSPFWRELQEVTTVQHLRLGDVDPEETMPLPDLWKGFDIHAVAEAVHDEFPGIHHVALINQLMQQGVRVDQEVIPYSCVVEFIRGIVMLSDLNTWSIATVGPLNFGVKYFAGRSRPEEVAWAIAQGELTSNDGVPRKLVDDIMALNLTSAVSYTAYPEGSPKHPSWYVERIVMHLWCRFHLY